MGEREYILEQIKTVQRFTMIILALDAVEQEDLISGLIQDGLATIAEDLAGLESQRLLRYILQSTELSWMREPERERRRNRRRE